MNEVRKFVGKEINLEGFVICSGYLVSWWEVAFGNKVSLFLFVV